MNFLERIPTRWLLTGAALACLVLWAGPGWAQSSADPVTGKALFDNTNEASGLNNFTADCIQCHSPGVQNRRTAIGGSPYADISLDTAMSRLGSAVGRVGGMTQFSRLGDDLQHIAAYIADTPKTNASELDFSPTAVNTSTLSQSVDLANAITSGSLTITAVAVTGTSAARFTVSADSCTSQTLPASTLATPSSCRVAVRFSAPDMALHTATLRMTMRVEGSTTTFTREVALSGRVATTTQPNPGSDDTGGGGLGLVWLGGLALATGVLGRRRRA